MKKIIIENLAGCDACGDPLGDDYPDWSLCKKCRKRHGIGEFRIAGGTGS